MKPKSYLLERHNWGLTKDTNGASLPSKKILKKIYSIASSYGYTSSLKSKNLVMQLSAERDLLLYGRVSASDYEPRLIKYACICLKEFKEFALMDDMILLWIADSKKSAHRNRKLAPGVRKIIQLLLEPVMPPKHQGQRDLSAMNPILIHHVAKDPYDKTLQSLQSKLIRKRSQRNSNSRLLSIKDVVSETFKRNSRAIGALEIDRLAKQCLPLSPNAIARQLVALALDINPHALHKALSNRYSLKK